MIVMQVEVCREDESCVFTTSPDDENVHVVLIENELVSARDTSASYDRDKSLDNTRQTVNTYNSILDLSLSRDDDDDEEQEDLSNKSVLFDELQSPELQEDEEPLIQRPTRNYNTDSSLLGMVTDSFVDSFCPAEVTVASCDSRLTSCSNNQGIQSSTSMLTCNDPHQARMAVGLDVWNLLGCSNGPGESELEEIWSFRAQKLLKAKQRPTRANIRQRMQRIKRLRMQGAGPTRHGVTISSHQVIQRASTMKEQHDELAHSIGKGLEPIMPETDGYDSDPEVSSTPASPLRFPNSSLVDQVEEEDLTDDIQGQDEMIRQTVQVRLYKYKKASRVYCLPTHNHISILRKHSIPPGL